MTLLIWYEQINDVNHIITTYHFFPYEKVWIFWLPDGKLGVLWVWEVWLGFLIILTVCGVTEGGLLDCWLDDTLEGWA